MLARTAVATAGVLGVSFLCFVLKVAWQDTTTWLTFTAAKSHPECGRLSS